MTFSSIWLSYHRISSIISRPVNRHNSKIKSNLDHYSPFITYSLFSVWIRPVISVIYQSLWWNFKPLIIPVFAGIKHHFKYPFNKFVVANEVHFSRFFSPLKHTETPRVFKKYVLFNWWQLFHRMLPKYRSVSPPTLFNSLLKNHSLSYPWYIYGAHIKVPWSSLILKI